MRQLSDLSSQQPFVETLVHRVVISFRLKTGCFDHAETDREDIGHGRIEGLLTGRQADQVTIHFWSHEGFAAVLSIQFVRIDWL